MKTICWMGGSRAAKPSQTTRAETSVRSYLFREQIETFRAHWGDYPDRDTLRIYFRRARMDAHATERERAKNPKPSFITV